MTNTKDSSKKIGFVLTLFCHRHLKAFAFSGHWPTFFRSTPRAPRQRGLVVRRPFPRWLLPSTDCRIGKERTGPDLDERPFLIQYVTKIQYVTEPGNFFGRIHPYLHDRRRTAVDHCHGAGGSQDQSGPRRACRSAWGRDAHPLSLGRARPGKEARCMIRHAIALPSIACNWSLP